MARVRVYTIEGDRYLYIDGKLWMWDTPKERDQQAEVAQEARGDVLVAGYGFGLVQRFLTENARVRSVTSVEKFREVVDEARKLYGKIYGEVVIGDFFDFDTDRRFDCVVGDIWEEVMPIYLPDYVRFKEKAKTLLRPGGVIRAWGQDFFEYLLDIGGRKI